MARALLLLGVLLAIAPPAQALRFEPPQPLPQSLPDDGEYNGGEPSIAFDPHADGHVYVTAPQGVPARAGGKTGVAFWGSADGGQTWPIAQLTGAGTGGGDSDVDVLGDHTVLVADLELVSSALCISADFGKTFPGCGDLAVTREEGAEEDRQWLAHGPEGVIYLTYNDFAGGYPEVVASTDGGDTFVPCGVIIDPAGPAATKYTPGGRTIMSKPLVADDGTVYVEFTTSDATAFPTDAPKDHLFMGIAKGGCHGATVFKDVEIYTDPGANLANIFQQSAIDGAGALYVLAAGEKAAGEVGSNLYLFTSSDHAETWSKPIRVNPPELRSNVFPTLAGGPARGEAFLGWFGTATSPDPNEMTNQWRFYGAVTHDGGRTLDMATITPDVIHYAAICTNGLLCDVPDQPEEGNRNLADFASAAVNPANGCVSAAIPGDPYNETGGKTARSTAFVARQLDGCMTKASAGAPATSAPPACLDRAAPTLSALRASVRRGRLRVSGRASDRGCLGGGRGSVARVEVAVARLRGHRCAYLAPGGRFGRPRACARPTFLAADGSSRFAFSAPVGRGRHRVLVRATDAAGNRAGARRIAVRR